jgi:hypothetical protein
LGTSVFGEDLVDGGAIQVALCESAVAIKDEGNVFAIVNVAFGADSPSSGTIGINAFGDAAVEGIIGVIDLAGYCAPSGGSDDNAGEAIAVIPGIVGDFSSGDVCAPGAVSFSNRANYPILIALFYIRQQV